jgi:hypothetical protein
MAQHTVKRDSTTSKIVAVGFVILIIGLAIWANKKPQIATVQQTSNQQSQQNTADVTAWNNLDNCINNADSWFNQNVNQPYITQQETILQSEQQQVSECQTRYPFPTGYNPDPLGTSLQGCLNSADNSYNKAVASATTINQDNFLLSVKEQFVSECQIKYPSS